MQPSRNLSSQWAHVGPLALGDFEANTCTTDPPAPHQQRNEVLIDWLTVFANVIFPEEEVDGATRPEHGG